MDVDQPQIGSNTGGLVWQVDDLKRLRRFLVLGSESPTYHIGEQELSLQNARSILNLLALGKGVDAVNEILEFSTKGRTVKQQSIIFALALCARKGDRATKTRAYEVLTEVCRIPTHIFAFVQYCEDLSQPTTGWGRAHRNALKKWYRNKPPMKLAMLITKYQKRGKWSHRDVARLMHLKPDESGNHEELYTIMKYIAHGWNELVEYYYPKDRSIPRRMIGENTNRVLQFLKAVEDVKKMTEDDEARVVELIEQFDLVREHIPTQLLNSWQVWRALAQKMPMTAMIRNLGKMTSVGLLNGTNPDEISRVCNKLRDAELLKAARIHPFNVLVALKIYMDGHGEKGRLTWEPQEAIAEALEHAFYLSFQNVRSTRKRYMLAIDVSGSMSHTGCAGTPCLTPRVAAAAMSMVTAKTEEQHLFVAFSDKIVPMMIDQDMTLEEVIKLMEMIPMGGTDCALPMLYAIQNNLMIDIFVVYTDCETKAGEVTPSEALQRYRQYSGIHDARLIVVAMTSNGFTIADPEDPGMLDMVGFDSAAPQVMREFVGEISEL